MNFDNAKQKRNSNIFNKSIIDVNKIYNNLLNNKITHDEIRLLNDCVAVITPKDKKELKNIVDFYE